MYTRMLHEPKRTILGSKGWREKKKRKENTLVESMSAWACSDIAHPVIKILEVNRVSPVISQRKGKIPTLLLERHYAIHCNQKRSMLLVYDKSYLIISRKINSEDSSCPPYKLPSIKTMV